MQLSSVWFKVKMTIYSKLGVHYFASPQGLKYRCPIAMSENAHLGPQGLTNRHRNHIQATENAKTLFDVPDNRSSRD